MVKTVSYNPEEFIFKMINQFWEIGVDNPNSPMADGRKPHLTHDWEGEDSQIPSVEVYNDGEKHTPINQRVDVYDEFHDVRVIARVEERDETWRVGQFLVKLIKELAINHHIVEGFEDNDFGRLQPVTRNRVIEYSADIAYWRFDILVRINKVKVYHRK